MAERRGGRRGAEPVTPRYPRTARVSQVLRQVVAEELGRLSDVDERLRLVTVTGVDVDPDLRHATVWLASMTEAASEALVEDRVRLQAAIGRQVRLKHTPQLAFKADPAVSTGQRIEEILHQLDRPADLGRDGGPGEDERQADRD
jgi:ribosome-binding factor A